MSLSIKFRRPTVPANNGGYLQAQDLVLKGQRFTVEVWCAGRPYQNLLGKTPTVILQPVHLNWDPKNKKFSARIEGTLTTDPLPDQRGDWLELPLKADEVCLFDLTKC